MYYFSLKMFLAFFALVFQPQFNWSDGTCTQQGTGSFIRAPNGQIMGLTSAHFLNFSGPNLLKVDWLDMKTKKAVACSYQCFGMPGHYNPNDLRSDYLLTIVEGQPDTQILDLDPREFIDVGERIWFPNKNENTGYDSIEGQVQECAHTHLLVVLDRAIDLHTRSGTPVISQRTGKVIGILTGGGQKDNQTCCYLAPSSSIYKALLEANKFPLLKDVIGSQK